MKTTVLISDFSNRRIDGDLAEIRVTLSDGRVVKLDATNAEAREILARAGVKHVPAAKRRAS